ncbi:threonine synthase [Pelotomaculum propionicicum]|uniref:Threonine synthase n=1 Tax=Pelotomaculum propionicicum TaxID=258475 RepID=A0A4Y7RWV1_9FIRM|nr:threonine synthase [Pelotomaculum propionicicum]TEB13464.1 Threonine synthase [Pelotomaculum propionicicum]
MLYESTRGQYGRVSAAEAIKLGLAPDGGLFVPCRDVIFTEERLISMAGLSYQDRAIRILEEYLGDYTREEIAACVKLAYSAEKFDAPATAPVRKLDDSLYVLELWHGPTCAFKDMALQILPHLLTRAAAKTGEKSSIVILVATSGDTGKAALEGFKDVPGTRIIVFYPEQGVSEVQKLQMITQEGNNVAVVAVRGNFDDAQTGVKSIFADKDFNQELQNNNYRLSSANSINWGRLVPQISYYFSAYLDLLAKGEVNRGEKINFVVPTGNFGNILAAYYAREMGLPVNKLICAANSNNVLTDFIRTGVYDRTRRFLKTISPSMDILISSNLERLLYHLSGRNPEKIRQWMGSLNKTGQYQVDETVYKPIGRIFWSDFASDSDTLATIKAVHQRYGYVMDTHTAVGMRVYERYREETGDGTKTVIASTASPFKFNESVVKAILGEDAVKGKNELELLEVLAVKSRLEIPAGLRNLDQKPVLFKNVVSKEEMTEAVRNLLLKS